MQDRSTRQGLPRPRTSELLRHLLVHDTGCRATWLRHVERAGRGDLNQAAVARVLAHHLWEIGERDDSDPETARRLRDTVNRALAGGVVSRRTLEWFIDAFGIDEVDSAQLWRRYAEDSLGPAAPVEEPADRTPVPATAYRTISLDERHFIGADGTPAKHETVQVIKAREPMDRYTFVFDTEQTSVDVFCGGSASTPYPTSRPGIYAVDIHLPRPLAAGETAVLGYRNVFHYQSSAPPEFRRVITSPVRSVVLQVHFQPQRVPSRIWFANWSDLHGEPDHRVEVECDPDFSVHRYLEGVSDTMVGFCWAWD